MGLDYALVHLKFTIPPALALSYLYRPLLTKLDVYKICFLVIIAVISTIPWDSYLIRSRVWTYPPNAVLGPVLFRIPLEELFFFVIQTYDTSLLYMILSRPTFHPACLPYNKPNGSGGDSIRTLERFIGIAGQLFLSLILIKGAILVHEGELGTYMGLIIIWAFPFLLLLWSLSHQFMLRLPLSNIIIPIILPTLYLWIVDTLALRRGTWVIERGTKYGIHIWDGLDIEEAFFFFVTNCLVVFGLIAFDNTLAIFNTFPHIFPIASQFFSPVAAIKALLIPISSYDSNRIIGLEQAISRLQKKSRSFFLASGAFEGRLRIDLVLLYSFCRVADDLVDGATDNAEAKKWIDRLRTFLDLAYACSNPLMLSEDVRTFVHGNFPPDVHLALLQLPKQHLSKQPLMDLLRGFEIDLRFAKDSRTSKGREFPIKNQVDLEQYAMYVAGTVAQLCIELALHHGTSVTIPAVKHRLIEAGNTMGIALQLVNISRDIEVDANISRVYIPTEWLKFEDLAPEAVLEQPNGLKIGGLRSRILDRAFSAYEEAREAIEELPLNSRAPMRVAVESYMEIGRVLRTKSYRVKAGKATVPKSRRLLVAWRAMNR